MCITFFPSAGNGTQAFMQVRRVFHCWAAPAALCDTVTLWKTKGSWSTSNLQQVFNRLYWASGRLLPVQGGALTGSAWAASAFLCCKAQVSSTSSLLMSFLLQGPPGGLPQACFHSEQSSQCQGSACHSFPFPWLLDTSHFDLNPVFLHCLLSPYHSNTSPHSSFTQFTSVPQLGCVIGPFQNVLVPSRMCRSLSSKILLSLASLASTHLVSLLLRNFTPR